MADESETAPQNQTVLGEGLPSNVDIHSLGDGDNPQADWGRPAEGEEVAYGSNHSDRGRKASDPDGQGPRTVQRNREIAKGKLYR